MRFTCSRCGRTHQGLPDVAFHRPDPILSLSASEREDCFESDDACMIFPDEEDADDLFLVRGVLHIPVVSSRGSPRDAAAKALDADDAGPIPMHETPEETSLLEQTRGVTWGLGVWASVGKEECNAVVLGDPGEFIEPFEGTLANGVPGFEGSFGERVLVVPGENTMRPSIVPLDASSRLARLRRDGVTLEEAWEWFHLAGLSVGG